VELKIVKFAVEIDPVELGPVELEPAKILIL
jgi:hypothetical protein